MIGAILGTVVLGGTHARVNQVNRADFGNVAGFTCTSITIVRAPRKCPSQGTILLFQLARKLGWREA